MSGDGAVEEIKNRLDIVEVIGDFMQLRKAGTSFKAPCPFHQEKTPSFFVSQDKQIWHCFGCGEGGDMFSFVMKIEGLEFPDALRLLAEKAGVKLERRPDDGQRSEKRRLYEVNGLAAKLYHKILLESPKAEAAREYVKCRALSDETVENFMLGFSPDSWEATSSFLKERDFNEQEIFNAGLAVKSERGTGQYDRFRGRLMFPIFDVNGEVIGFTGRIMPGADGKDPDGPKYVNTPQTLIYNKSRALYGINLAKQDIRKQRSVVVVEGNMDVISSHQAGVRNVIASSGTALTDDHLTVLKRFADRVVLSFDDDAAGENAARRGIDSAVAAGFAVRVLRLPEGVGKDPDDCIRKDVELWKKAIEDAVPYMAWYTEIASERTDFGDGESKRRSADELLREVAKIPDPVERSHWVTKAAQLFSTPESLLFEKLKGLKVGKYEGRKVSPDPTTDAPIKAKKSKNRESLVTEYVVGMAFSWPQEARRLIESVLSEGIHPEYAGLYSSFRGFYNAIQHDGDNAPSFHVWLEARESHEEARRAVILELLAEKEFGGLTPEQRAEEMGKLIGELESLQISRQKQELARAMGAAEKKGDMERIREIQEQLNEIMG
ncbi:MAG: DNA primase [Patescibacteria group bacterium]|nr:DNA primase [Patescibacteria group bacterium]